MNVVIVVLWAGCFMFHGVAAIGAGKLIGLEPKAQTIYYWVGLVSDTGSLIFCLISGL